MFLGNRIEVGPEEAPPEGSTYDPRREDGILTYYNPGLGARVKILKFGEGGVIPSFDNEKVWATLATDHLVQHNNLARDPLYIKIQGIAQKIKERASMSRNERVLNIKMALPTQDQHLVDLVNAIIENTFVPTTWEDNVAVHAVKTALEKPRFELRGGRKKKTMRRKRKIRSKSRK